METVKVDWLVFCGRAECNAWIDFMETECIESVRINTPTSFKAYLSYPFTGREIMEYFAEDFAQAIAKLDDMGE